MMNTICVMGRLTADPELRHTQGNIPVTTFRIAVDRDHKDKDGTHGTDFIPVVCWRGTAEFVSRYLSKGRLIGVTGRLQVRDFTDKDGNRKTVTEILADSIYFGDAKKEEKKDPFYPVDDDAEIPF